MKTFLIIDGSSVLSAAYYATIPKSMIYAKTEEDRALYYPKLMQTHDGVYTNAVVSMLHTTLNIIRDQKPDYLAFVFDQTRDTFRRKLYPDYKGTRSETPEPLKEQFFTMEHILKIFGFQVFYSPEYEADDYAGSLCARFCEEVDRIYLLTKDMDYLQLVDDKKGIRAWMTGYPKTKGNRVPSGVKEFGESEILEKYGLKSGKQIVEHKALVGDKSDNIPGLTFSPQLK